ncbi:MAG: endonuclease/exonuclease/phosphatase family protein [Bacteroidota bacterium]
MQLAHFTISLLALFATGIAFANIRIWWIYAMRAQRWQIGLLLLLLLVSTPFLLSYDHWLHYLFAIVLFGGALLNFYKILPFTPFGKYEVPLARNPKTTISLLASNVREKNDDYHRLLDRVRDLQPELLVITELNHDWQEALSELRERYPHYCEVPKDNGYGMGIYSCFPMRYKKILHLVEDGIPSIHCHLDLPDGRLVQLIGLHPSPPAPWNEEEHKDLELIKAAGITNLNLHPTLVAGDLNDVAWSPVTSQFKTISGLRDPRIGRGFYSTYNAFVPFFRMPIDHVFVSQHFSLVDLQRLPSIGSDHFPIYIKVSIDE